MATFGPATSNQFPLQSSLSELFHTETHGWRTANRNDRFPIDEPAWVRVRGVGLRADTNDRKAVGPMLATSFQVGKLNRGVLQLYAVDSVVMQELTFQKRQILRKLSADHPQAKIKDVRFRVQAGQKKA